MCWPATCCTASPAPDGGAAVRVSVLLTTRNGATLLRETLASVLAQDFPDFEVVVVDDASTDATPRMLAACTDPRLRVLRSDRQLGVAEARNFGFSHCRGAYIAAQDHDDISRPGRLVTEAAYLDDHPDIVMVGSEVLISRDGGLQSTDHLPGSTPALLRWMLHVDNPFTWSSVMFRADAVRGLDRFMRREYEPADDFDLYHRLLALGGIARLDDVLCVYRWHDANTSLGQMQRIHDRAAAVLARAYRPWLGDDAADTATLVVTHLTDRRPAPDSATLARLGRVLERVLVGYCAAATPDPATRLLIEAYTARAWWLAARAAVRSGTPTALLRWRDATALRAAYRRPTVRDIAQSLAIGTARAVLRRA
jgi:GT2 family glycosyltransferase